MIQKQEIDYCCSKCESCLFADKYTDMGAFLHLCLATKPFDFLNKAHIMTLITANDCDVDKNMLDLYYRECPMYVNIGKLRKFILAYREGV